MDCLQKTRKILVATVCVVSALTISAAGRVFASGEPGIEFLPVAVWQGKVARPWNIAKFEDLRRSFPEMRVAHVISAAPLARSENEANYFRSQIIKVIKSGDDIALHLAPWKSISMRANIEYHSEPTLFGSTIPAEDCARDCGLDLSFRAFSPSGVYGMINTSIQLLRNAGFGKIRTVFFDEGLATKDARDAARSLGLDSDWSGIELTQLNAAMGRFPVYAWNRDAAANLPLDSSSDTFEGIQLDHVRFGIHAEIADTDRVGKILSKALEIAKRDRRTVRVPLIFNVEDLIHTHGLVSEAIKSANAAIRDAQLKSDAYIALNTTWSIDQIKPTSSDIAINRADPSDSRESNEPEFVPLNEVPADLIIAH